MKSFIHAPIDKLNGFRQLLNLQEEEYDRLKPFRELFISRKKEFSEFLFHYFHEIPETRIFLDHEKRRNLLKNVWENWFETLFQESFHQSFLQYPWQSGLRHVEVNIDQQFINLGYAQVRQFCSHIIRDRIPKNLREDIGITVDKMIDLCLLIETHAYITATSRCDMEIVKGISHQVRNPLTVIGGNIIRLQRQVAPDNPLHKIYDMILDENKRLEGMVRDVGVYSDMFQNSPVIENQSLEQLLSSAIEKLKQGRWPDNLDFQMDLSPSVSQVRGDFADLETMFYHLLQNSLEAVDPDHPFIQISAHPSIEESAFVDIEIFNNGEPPSPEIMEDLFVPFFSTKPQGTGFGLPIAQLAARKNRGDILVDPVPGKGTRCVIRLPGMLRESNPAAQTDRLGD